MKNVISKQMEIEEKERKKKHSRKRYVQDPTVSGLQMLEYITGIKDDLDTNLYIRFTLILRHILGKHKTRYKIYPSSQSKFYKTLNF